MKIELLFVSDCPNYLETWSILEDVLQAEGFGARIEMIRVQTEEEAQKLQFSGSPTIRIDGRDIEDLGESEPQYTLGYRRYKGGAGPRGLPSRALIHKAVQERLSEPGAGK